MQPCFFIPLLTPILRAVFTGKRIRINRSTHCAARVYPICPYYAIRAHLRYAVLAERRGCEDPLQRTGPLQRRLHAGHLHPHHPEDAPGGGGYHRERYRSGNVSELAGADGRSPSAPEAVRVFALIPNLGRGFWLSPVPSIAF